MFEEELDIAPQGEAEAAAVSADAPDPKAQKNRKIKKGFKIAGITAGATVAAVILTVVVYLLYVILSFSRIADNISLGVKSNQQAAADESRE